MCQFLLLFFAFVLVTGADALTREANETLRLPSSLPGGSFKTESFFEELSFDRPVALVTPPGETQRLFVVEQRGRIAVIPNLEDPVKETFLDLRDVTSYEGEAGLLGLAFHPRYEENGWFYVFYTLREGGRRMQRVARFTVDAADPNQALRDSEQPLFEQRDEASNHNGGDLHFGTDGYLYIALGDEGGANDQFDNSRFIDQDFFCAIARIDVDQQPGSLKPNAHTGVFPNTYTIPADNPFIGTTEFAGRAVDPDTLRTEFWAVGLRNPWRLHVDRTTGRLFCADVGQNAREEINLISRGGHYGWSFREGKRSFTRGPEGSNVPDGFAPLEPIWDYSRGDGVSVTGGVVYRGSAHTELYESYIFGDYGSGQIWALHFNDDASVRVEEIASDSQISAFGTDPRNGDVLFTSYGRGEVKRIARKSQPFGLLIPSKLSRTGAFVDLETLTPQPGIVPYEPNVSFWSDGAEKRRWFSVPELEDTISFDPTKPWTFPVGTTWIKHFEIGDPDNRLRLETRFLVKTETGSYGLTYAWNEDQTDADLVDSEGEVKSFIVTEGGVAREQEWLYPSRNACRACHTQAAGQALGFSTEQLNRAHSQVEDPGNQLEVLSEAGYFGSPISANPAQLPQLAPMDDPARSLEDRARSYLSANCSQCHQPNGPALGFWDARFSLPLSQVGIVDGPLQSPQSNADMRVIAPGSIDHSMILTRMRGADGLARMPPVGSNRLDEAGLALIREWVLSLDGPPITGGYENWIARFRNGQPMLAEGSQADPDRDGQSNYHEFIADTHPGLLSERWRVEVEASPAGNFLTLPATPNGRIEIEASEDNARWVPLTLSPDSVATLPDGSVQVRLAPEIPQRIYRFRLLEGE